MEDTTKKVADRIGCRYQVFEKGSDPKLAEQAYYAALEKGKNILFYPEAALMPYCNHIRNFLPGAFHYAVLYDRPIVPCCYTFHKPKGIYKLLRGKKPVVHFHILEPYYIKHSDNRNETIQRTTEEVHKIISDFFLSHNEYDYDKEKTM